MAQKLALITGSASGIGYEISRTFVKSGYRVIGIDINQRGLDLAHEEMGNNFSGMVCDISSIEQIKAVADFVQSEYGRLNTLINNAGVGKFISLEDMTESDYLFHFDTLLKGPMFLAKYSMHLLQKSEQSSIINIASAVGQIEIDNHHLYSCAKLALEKFTRHLVRDYPGIRSNTILPGLIDTPIYRTTGLDDQQIADTFAQISKTVPCGRIGKPEDIANCALFLSSPAASYINGASIPVDGGWLHSANWGI